MTLYHTEWCPECVLVRSLLDELEIEYKSVIVPTVRPFRKQVFEVSGQYYVPVLVDGDTVLTETPDILDYLDDLASAPERQKPVDGPVDHADLEAPSLTANRNPGDDGA